LDVHAMAGKILAAVVAHFAASTNPADADLPDRRYVGAGDPLAVAWDCEQLTVTMQGVTTGAAVDARPLSPRSGTPSGVALVRSVTYVVSLVRCHPTQNDAGDPPPVADLEAAGVVFARDMGVLSQALVELASQLRENLPVGQTVQAGEVAPVGPDGSFVALVAPVSFTVGTLV
jgi:hypothetical protein